MIVHERVIYEITDEDMTDIDDNYIAKTILKHGKGHFFLIGKEVNIRKLITTIYKHNKNFLFQLVDIPSIGPAGWSVLFEIDKDGEFIDHIDDFYSIGVMSFTLRSIHFISPLSLSDNVIDKLITMVKTVRLSDHDIVGECIEEDRHLVVKDLVSMKDRY